MKKIIKLILTLSVAANSLMAWSYYPSNNYDTYRNYGSHYTPYKNWQYPTSYGQPYQPYQPYESYQQGCPAPRAPQSQPTTARPGSLEQQYNNLIIMFTKDNCPYCIYMKPIMKEAEMKFGNDIKFLYVDITQNPQYPAQYGFSTVPHIVYFKDGKQLDAHGSGDKTMTVQQVEQRIRNLGLSNQQ